MEAGGALAVIAQPDVRIRRLLTVVPRHFQASVGRVQLGADDSCRRQVRMVASHRCTEQQCKRRLLIDQCVDGRNATSLVR